MPLQERGMRGRAASERKYGRFGELQMPVSPPLHIRVWPLM